MGFLKKRMPKYTSIVSKYHSNERAWWVLAFDTKFVPVAHEYIILFQIIADLWFLGKVSFFMELPNPRAFRALEQALDPSRKGPRASRTYIHAQYQDF